MEIVELKNKKIFLVGIAHIGKKSREDVRNAIDKFKPTSIAVELDAKRYARLKRPKRWKEKDLLKIIKSGESFLLILNLMLASIQRKLGKAIKTKPGQEMLEAIKIAKEEGKRIELIDREVGITLRRAFSFASIIEKAKFFTTIIKAIFQSEDEVSEEEIEKIRKTNMLDALMKSLAKEFPSMKKALVDERDEYMAAKLLSLKNKKILAVVGAGHVKGLTKTLKKFENFSREELNTKMKELEETPRKKNYLKLLVSLIFPMLFIVIVAYLLLFKGVFVGLKALAIWFLAVSSLAALGAAIARATIKTIIISFLVAPLTAIHPMLAVGWFSALVEAKEKPPRVKDFEELQKIESIRQMLKNRVMHLLVVAALANLGATIGLIVVLPYLLSLL